MTMTWRVEKRVANTEVWGVVDYATSREDAVRIAREVLGGQSTGVRIVRVDDPYATPETIVGV